MFKVFLQCCPTLNYKLTKIYKEIVNYSFNLSICFLYAVSPMQFYWPELLFAFQPSFKWRPNCSVDGWQLLLNLVIIFNNRNVGVLDTVQF